MAKIEQRLYELGIELPSLYEPVANYLSVRKTGDLLYLSGAGPLDGGEIAFEGKIGKDLSKEDGYIAARMSALNMISILKNELGNLDRVEKIIKLQGFVACSEDFYDQPYVINGASDLFVEVFGEAGKHARAALGTNVLPFNTPVEILLIVQIKEELE